MAILKYYGHSCFQLTKGNHSLIFDPFLTDNPFNVAAHEDIECSHILVSHAHFDHIGDALEISKRTGALIISTAEIAHFAANADCNNHAMHIGGKKQFEFGYVRITPAFHGAGIPGGHACGFIVKFYDKTIYFAGDTGIFGDMELLGRLEKIDYALLPIGDNFTMGADDATTAAAMLKTGTVIPMHYNTWPVITQSPEKFKEATEKKTGIPVVIIEPGTSITI